MITERDVVRWFLCVVAIGCLAMCIGIGLGY